MLSAEQFYEQAWKEHEIKGTNVPTTYDLMESYAKYKVDNFLRPEVMIINTERTRQIEGEGWTAEHDDQHKDGQLSLAAAYYATPQGWRKHVGLLWPWSVAWWKPTPDARIRELSKAGALIAAEIARLLRKKS